MPRRIENEIAHDAILLAEKLIILRDVDHIKYLMLIDNLKKDLGTEFYNKYIAWHERDDANATDD